MKLSLIQMSPATGDLEGNAEKIISEIKNAKKQGADLVIFPEMALTGYCISDLIENDYFVEKNEEFLDEIAKETNGISAIVGFIDYERGKVNEDGRVRKYNAAALLSEGKILGIAHKTLLPSYRYFDDKRYFTEGKERKVFRVKGMDIGISICEDMWDKDYDIKPIKELAEKGAEIIVNINASPYYYGKFNEREETIKRHIKETGLPFIYVNAVGASDNGKNIITFDGESLVYDKLGNLIALGNQFKEESIIVNLNNARTIERINSREEKEIYEGLIMSLRDYSNQVGFTKAIVPVSGGVDSALGIAIAVEAFGKENVTAFNLPSRFNTEITKGIAAELCRNLGVEYKIIPIQEIDNTIREVFSENVHEIKNKIAKENIQARVRGILMMLESNDTGTLLISNGNKTEIALGYSTLYGDMCGGISVIGDLSKTDVYKVSKYVNERYGKEIIPREVFEIKPSAELSEGQFDPFDYEVVSPLVDLMVEERESPKEIIDKFKNKKLGVGFTDKVYMKYSLESFEGLVFDTYKLLRKSVYKRLQGPPIITVTKRAFGFDLRETMINKWEGR
ncbi:MAG TPA: NAD+ synthase [Candidatus Nanoarchaeia archaeon]|nr:NAD+ synthase [Candidatus Nanoarchaeia archaeon]